MNNHGFRNGFLAGFGIAFGLAVLVTGVLVQYVIIPAIEERVERQVRAELEPRIRELEQQIEGKPELYIVPDRLTAAPGQKVTLTPVCKNMDPPISITWSADCGEGLPRGWVDDSEQRWTAPEDMCMAHITATAKDSTGRVASGELTQPVFPPKQPE